jgi:hypothetical protein
VFFNGDESTTVVLVPVLNFSTNGKILRWRNYAQTFKPFFSEDTRKADSEVVPFPDSKILEQLKGKPQIPILIPREVLHFKPLVNIINDRLDVKASTNSYSICSWNCLGPTRRQFNSFSASVVDGKSLPSRSEIDPGPRDTFQGIELVHGIQGIFYEGCGAYCSSFVEWNYQGVLYQVNARFGEQPLLVRIANSAIEAGIQ